MDEKRTERFERNQSLEGLLEEVNENLWLVEKELVSKKDSKFPVVFIVGPHRSGSTLLMQWLANTGVVSYPTNLLSRFYKAPIIGAKLQLLLTDERFNYRDELKDFNSNVDFQSENGKTKGALAPNEFWYFWRRFLPFGELDYLPTSELNEKVDTDLMRAEFAGMMHVFQKPMALKAMILNYNIDFLDQLFENAIFIHTKRDPLTNIASALDARKRQLGSIDEWYSFKIPEYDKLRELNPYEQVAGQIYHINKAVETGLENVAEHKKMTVNYEDFCVNPKAVYDVLCENLKANGFSVSEPYSGQEKFELSRIEINDRNILNSASMFHFGFNGSNK